MSRRNLIQMLVAGVIATLVLIALSLAIHWFPKSADTQAGSIDTLYDVLLIVSIPFFVLVCTVVIFSVLKFRHRPGDPLRDGPPIHGNTRLEVVWTAVPAVLLVSLCTYAYAVLHHIEKGHPNEMVVNVTGQQFAWRFDYPQAGKKVVSDQLYLPVNRPIIFKEHALDVLHSFWVPQFRIKNDAVPGIVTTQRVTPNRIGTYPIVCAELCGLGHSTMRSTVHVVPEAQFTAWLQKQSGASGSAGGAAPQSGSSGGSNGAAGGQGGGQASAAQGKAIFTGQGGCGACHTLKDAATAGRTGPDLDSALKGKSPSFIMQSIVNPNAEIAKGYPANVMPQSFGKTLSKDQIASLVSYLGQVTR